MDRKRLLYWLPLPMLLAGVIYLLVYRQVTIIPLALIFGALALAGIAVQVGRKP